MQGNEKVISVKIIGKSVEKFQLQLESLIKHHLEVRIRHIMSYDLLLLMLYIEDVPILII
jgi:hypothetical protein